MLCTYIYIAISILLALPGISCKMLMGQYYSLVEEIQKGFPVPRSVMDREMVKSEAKSSISNKKKTKQTITQRLFLWAISLVHTLSWTLFNFFYYFFIFKSFIYLDFIFK